MAGWIKVLWVSALSLIPQASRAEDITCRGADPDWLVVVSDTSATFEFGRTSAMQIMQDDIALNDPNIRAMTLVGPRDSAIVIVDTEMDRATVLTQRGQTPVVITGTCDQP